MAVLSKQNGMAISLMLESNVSLLHELSHNIT